MNFLVSLYLILWFTTPTFTNNRLFLYVIALFTEHFRKERNYREQSRENGGKVRGALSTVETIGAQDAVALTNAYSKFGSLHVLEVLRTTPD